MKKTFSKILVVLVMVLSITFLSGCKKNTKPLVGSWEHSGFVYTFNEDNTGNYNAAGTVLKFTYEDKGTKVSIKYDGNTVASEFEYKIEGKKLIIKDSFNNNVEYTRK